VDARGRSERGYVGASIGVRKRVEAPDATDGLTDARDVIKAVHSECSETPEMVICVPTTYVWLNSLLIPLTVTVTTFPERDIDRRIVRPEDVITGVIREIRHDGIGPCAALGAHEVFTTAEIEVANNARS